METNKTHRWLLDWKGWNDDPDGYLEYLEKDGWEIMTVQPGTDGGREPGYYVVARKSKGRPRRVLPRDCASVA